MTRSKVPGTAGVSAGEMGRACRLADVDVSGTAAIRRVAVTVARVSDEPGDDEVRPQRGWLERLSPHQFCGHRPVIGVRVGAPQQDSG